MPAESPLTIHNEPLLSGLNVAILAVLGFVAIAGGGAGVAVTHFAMGDDPIELALGGVSGAGSAALCTVRALRG